MLRWVSVFDGEEMSASGEPRPVLTEARLTLGEASLVGAYLEAGAGVAHPRMLGPDLLAGDAPVVPLTIRTDGVHVWAGPVTYYVRRYAVAPDADFLAYVRARNYEPRVPDEAELEAADEFVLGP